MPWIRSPSRRRNPWRGVPRWAPFFALVAACPHVAQAQNDLPEQKPTPVEAEGPDRVTEARRLYAEARARFDAREYDTAIAGFRRAYELVPANRLLYNIAQALRLSGHCAEAVRTYREFIAAEPDGQLREYAEARVSALGECREATQPAEPAPPILGSSSTSSSTAPASAVGADPPRPTAVRKGHAVPAAALAPLGARAHAAPEHAQSAGSRGVSAAIALGSAVALFTASGYFAWRADRASDRVSRAFERGERWSAGLAASERDGRRSRTIALATLGGGLLASGIGTWVLVFD